MIHQARIPLTAPSEWKKALEGIEHTFAHTWENAYAMHLTSGNETYLYTFTADDVRMVCPISERIFEGYTDIVTPYGLSGFVGNGSYAPFPAHWKQFARTQGYVCGYMSVHPLFENETWYARDALHPHHTIYVVDLTCPKNELFARLSTNRRRQLKDVDAASGIVDDREMLAAFFIAEYRSFMDRKSAASVYHFSDATLSFLANAENTFLIGAADSDDRLEAVALFGYTEQGATYLFSVASAGAGSHTASLIWHAMIHAKSIGIPWLDLGGGIRENDSVAEFKRRFGGDALPLKAAKQVFEPDIFASLCRRMNVAPELTGYFPPYRRP